MRKVTRKALSLVLSFLMTLSVELCNFPIASFAAEETNHIWTKVDLEDISADDSIAIAITTADGETYVLPNAETSKAPVATLAKLDNGSLTIPGGNDSDYAWTITEHTVETTTKKNDENDSEPKEEEVVPGSLSASSEASAATTEKSDTANEASSEEPIIDEDDKSKDSVGDAAGAGSKSENKNSEDEKSQPVNNEKKTLGVTTTNQAAQVNSSDVSEDDDDTEDEVTTEKYYTISSGSDYLYTIAENKGVRVSASSDSKSAKWKIEGDYLCTPDTQGIVRYLGVYNKSDFRAYTKDSNNAIKSVIKGQKVSFYKLTNQLANGAVPAPKASIESGEAVDYNAELTLTCDVEDAEIFYNLDEGENFTKYEDSIKIYKDTTVTAYASKDNKDSERVTFEYTLEKGVKITDLKTIKDGQEFVLVNGDEAALSSSANGKKLSPVAVELDSDKVLTCKKDSEKLAKLKLEEGKEADQYYIITELTESGETKEYYLTSGATGSELYFTEAPANKEDRDDLGLWTFENSDDGKFNLKNVKALYNGEKPQYLEYYKEAFTTYSCKNSSDNAFIFSAYTTPELEDGEGTNTSTDKTEAKLLKRNFYNGDKVVVYYPAKKTLMTNEFEKSYFKAIEAAPNEEGILDIADKNAKVFTVSVDEDGNCKLKDSDGKYLTATVSEENKCGLALSEEETDNSIWKLKNADDSKTGNFNLINVNAKKGTSNVALEYYEKYDEFTSYGFSNNNAIFVFNFFVLEEGEDNSHYESDSDTELVVAQWAGNAEYPKADNSKEYICGDLYETNDMEDEDSVYKVYVGGSIAQPYTSVKSQQTGSTSYYMGSTGVLTQNDYMQMEFPTKGFADMKLSFRMRSSNTAVGAYQLQYSTTGEDGSFKNIKDGSYKYSITVYRDNKPSEKNGSGDITDGIAKTSLAPGKEVSFEFKIPEGANNKEKVYIRIVPCTNMAADGKKEAVKGGVNRLDSVVVLGHPIVSDDICGHIVADPASGEIPAGTKIALSSGTEGADIYYSVNGKDEVKYDPDEQVTLDELPAIVRARGTKDGLEDSITSVYKYTQSQVMAVTANPNGGAIAQSQKIILKTKTEDATILYRYKTKSEVKKDDEAASTESSEETADIIPEEIDDNHHDWIEYTEPFEAKELPTQIQVKAVKEGYLDSAISNLKFTKRINERDNIYFGQIHSHTSISDGAGSLKDAYEHAKKVDNLDYIIVTDHSNSIDNEKESMITKNVDKSENDEWSYAHKLAKESSTDDFTCAYGYEMTWSNGLGHMNTYNTAGFQSRTQTDYSTYSTALNNYYAALRTAPDSISQFNHPGTTFGDFQDFAYYSEENDALITLIEVGNGEGAIGSSGYFPSYEYYTRALDKGWHVAPTNNQDNHKGLWGDANTARTVVLADTNDEDAIYDAMRNYRVYATEDNDLSIYYTLDNYVMGTILDKDAVGDTVNIKAEIKDPTDSAIGKVEVIVNGGQSIASKQIEDGEETVEFTVPSSYSYYYLKISEKDRDIAVTAPVWVGEVEACGINKTYTDTVLPVAGEDLDVNVEFYNNEKTPLEINSIKVDLSDVDGKVTPVTEVTGEEAKVKEVPSNGTATYKTVYKYDQAGQVTYQITVNATLNGVEKVYKDKLTVNYVLPKMVSEVIIDGTHANDYVSGYYTGNVNAFVTLCANSSVRAKVVKDKITPDMLKDCKLLVISAPAKQDGGTGAGEYKVSHFSDDFINMVKEYVKNGGSVIVCGIADFKDTTDCQTATEQNKLLEAIGATIRMGSDEVCDDTHNGGQVYRMYPETFNMESDLLAGIKNGQVYSQYSGCSVDISNAKATNFVDAAEWLVKGFDTTYSVDCRSATGAKQGSELPNKVVGIKNDNLGDVTFLARQKTKAGGQIIVAGGVFLSDFEVKAEIDNNDSLPYANYTIVNNIIEGSAVELETTPIAEARKGKMNEVFAVEGYVTAGTEKQGTTFFDTIYIQDETGGIDIFPYATPGLKIGTKVRIVGFLAQYQGDLELKVKSAKVLDDAPYVWKPKAVDTKTAMDYNKLGGQLLQTTGVVTEVKYGEGGTVEEFWLKDSSGVEAAIFIDGYITSGTTNENNVGDFVKKGAKVTAGGILYMHPEGAEDKNVPVLRVRDCDDIYLAKENAGQSSGSSDQSSTGSGSDNGSGSSHSGGSDSGNGGGSDNGNSNTGSGTNAGAANGAASTGASEAATAASSAVAGDQTTGQTGKPNGGSSHSNNGGESTGSDNSGNGGDDSQATGGDTSSNTEGQNPGVEVQSGGDETIGEQVTGGDDTGKPSGNFPVVPVAAGAGIIVVAVVTVVIKVSAGASIASGGKLGSLIAKFLKLFGK